MLSNWVYQVKMRVVYDQDNPNKEYKYKWKDNKIVEVTKNVEAWKKMLLDDSLDLLWHLIVCYEANFEEILFHSIKMRMTLEGNLFWWFVLLCVSLDVFIFQLMLSLINTT